MSFTTPDLIRKCRGCGRELAPDALVCDSCHTLVYSEQLDRLAQEAKASEAAGDLRRARDLWLSGLRWLPSTSMQAHWIEDHARALEAADPNQVQGLNTVTSPPQSRTIVGKRGVFNLWAVLSFAAFVAIYSRTSGIEFGIGFALLILIHEMGHYIDIRRRGLPADMPIFLPGLGAYVRWQALGVPLSTRAEVSLAGPFAGFLAAAVCAVLWWQTRDPYWLVLARVGAALNLLNLIPVWILDGGHAALALSKNERIALLVASLLLWAALREKMLLLVAAGAAYSAFFASDLPPYPSRRTTIYYVAVITALAAILRILPGHGFGSQ